MELGYYLGSTFNLSIVTNNGEDCEMIMKRLCACAKKISKEFSVEVRIAHNPKVAPTNEVYYNGKVAKTR